MSAIPEPQRPAPSPERRPAPLGRFSPTRTEAVDLAFAVVLLVLGIVGFGSTFAGNEEILTGVPAVLAGGTVAYVCAKLRVDPLPAIAVGAVVFVLLASPIALTSDALFRVLPTPASVQGMVSGLVSGWVRLLTSLPPAGEAGNLLMVPYAVGFVGAALTIVVAVLWPRSPACVMGPVAVMVVSQLFGTREPASLLLQGIVFGAVLIAWLAIRESRRREIVIGVPGRQRLVQGGGLVVVLAAAASVVGPALPGADANPRFVLREQIEPPFDPLAEPSPLAGYRRYTGAENEDAPVLEVTGLPAGATIRLAVLDDYDGLVWRATGDGSAPAGRFVRIGEEVPGQAEGTAATIDLTVLQPHGVWLPTVGEVRRVDLGTDERRDQMRFNPETHTAAIPAGVAVGETYTLDVVLPASAPDEDLSGLPVDAAYGEARDDLPNEIVEYAAQLSGGAEAPYVIVSRIAEQLRTDGAFSDGGPDASVTTPPGHGLSRLARFLGAPQWVGNGEQYAAALGLLARAQGVPARVVMGFTPERRADKVTITGADVTAWVEIPLDGVGWVPVNATPPEDQVPDPSVKPRPRPLNPEPQPPPPPIEPPPASLPQDLDASETTLEECEALIAEAEAAGRDAPAECQDEDDETADDGLPVLLIAGGGLTLAVLLPIAVIVGLKARRRRRRRSRGTPKERAAGGWAEVLDRAVDLGGTVPRQSTRTEAADTLGTHSATRLATRSDVATFGPSEPTQDDLDALWREVDEVLAELRGQRGPGERLRGAVSLRSLRRKKG